MMANMWYAAWLGSDSKGGDRPRLRRELDHLKTMGISCVRALASSEGCMEDSPICGWSIEPAMQLAPGRYDHHILVGLDLLMFELSARGMVAVLILNSMTPDSGGMAQYVEWAEGPEAPVPKSEVLQGVASWNRVHFSAKAARFYEMPKAMHLSHNHIRFLLGRRNAFNGRLYSQDPTIMSWEIANAPRPMGKTEPYRKWIATTAKLLKRLAPSHLVTIGSEGAHAANGEEWTGRARPTSGWVPDVSDFVAEHSIEGIDYATCQIWIESWGWYHQTQGGAGLASGVERAKQYLHAHMQAAVRMGKPLVISEVGLSRDDSKLSKNAGVTRRNAFLKAVFEQVQASVTNRDALAGVGFAGWSGTARPLWRNGSNAFWRAGDPWLGDRTTSMQGLNSVYDTDKSTIELITKYAKDWTDRSAAPTNTRNT